MAVVIAYQSLNSNSSSNHGVSASNSQTFTRKTHDQVAQSTEPWMLSLPTAEGVSPNVPIQGPAQLLPTAPSGFMNKGLNSDSQFLSMVEGKARQIHQNLIRAFPNVSCDLLVFGELDSSNSEWSSIQGNAGPLLHSSNPAKACNCFSVHNTGAFSSKIAEGTGWLAVACGNVVAVFVHVPNSIAKSESGTISFYQEINTAVLSKGKGAIDVIMGDTNQSSSDFTPRIVSKALGVTFNDAHPSSSIKPFDAHETSFGGTNSTASKKYDVAVYNTTSVKKIEAIYLSQFSRVGSGVAAVTDHMGICVYLEK